MDITDLCALIEEDEDVVIQDVIRYEAGELIYDLDSEKTIKHLTQKLRKYQILMIVTVVSLTALIIGMMLGISILL